MPAQFHPEAYNAMMHSKQGNRDAAIEHGAVQKKSAEIGACITPMKKDPAFA
ncbi:hypothetical protein MKK75_30950 [Methylobacterium sp. J-030]|uniref:hypothetical protein n=1 Tax=Methylobacterium sp. J-030 TaxID=2836627 RepID=UPI001FBBFDCA|nr:hypothetical protein [Methylobacterium sp. J-030]MCJ2073152.1 hypothetical protein [Methylobacterium sp. J-030]